MVRCQVLTLVSIFGSRLDLELIFRILFGDIFILSLLVIEIRRLEIDDFKWVWDLAWDWSWQSEGGRTCPPLVAYVIVSSNLGMPLWL